MQWGSLVCGRRERRFWRLDLDTSHMFCTHASALVCRLSHVTKGARRKVQLCLHLRGVLERSRGPENQEDSCWGLVLGQSAHAGCPLSCKTLAPAEVGRAA
jgi:hypothetical protein